MSRRQRLRRTLIISGNHVRWTSPGGTQARQNKMPPPAEQVLSWMETAQVTIYYHPTNKLWQATDQYTMRLGRTMQEAVEALIKAGLEELVA